MVEGMVFQVAHILYNGHGALEDAPIGENFG